MNILIDRLPETVKIRGVEYPIRTGFRTSVLFELLVRDKKVKDEYKIDGLLRLYYEKMPPDREEAVKQALWFYNCGKEQKKKETKNKTSAAFRKNKALYSFEKDAHLIYAAFKDQYGIDLQDIEDLHWWKFSAMFDGLKNDHPIRQIMEIRGMSTSGMSKKQIQHINTLKEMYSLEDTETVDSKVALAKRNADMKAYLRKRMQEVKLNARK